MSLGSKYHWGASVAGASIIGEQVSREQISGEQMSWEQLTGEHHACYQYSGTDSTSFVAAK